LFLKARMSDDKLRCALVYRIDGPNEEGGASVVLLSKYDHASQYETHGGRSGDETTLYGGRDKSFAEAVELVISNDPPGAASHVGTIGGFKIVHSNMHQVVYGSDSDGLCKILNLLLVRFFFGLLHSIN